MQARPAHGHTRETEREDLSVGSGTLETWTQDHKQAFFRKASDTAPDGRYAWETVKSVVIHTEVKSPMDSSENRVTAEALPLLELQVTWGRLPASSESQRVFCDPSLERSLRARSTLATLHVGDHVIWHWHGDGGGMIRELVQSKKTTLRPACSS